VVHCFSPQTQKEIKHAVKPKSPLQPLTFIIVSTPLRALLHGLQSAQHFARLSPMVLLLQSSWGPSMLQA